MRKLILKAIVIVLMSGVASESFALNKQQVDFFNTVQKIRKSIGMEPLKYSSKLQREVTDKHGDVIKAENVLMRKANVSVSTLGMMEVIMSCNTISCKLPNDKYVRQSPKDEAYSLFWRKDDVGKLFNRNSKRMSVTIVHRIGKPDVVIATASK